jgi:hypothetical protein
VILGAVILAAVIGVIAGVVTGTRPPDPPKKVMCERCGAPSVMHVYAQDLCGPCACDEDRRRCRWSP